MSSPLDQFSTLSLTSPMPQTGFEKRKAEVRDVLSCFDRHLLPQEFLPDLYGRISRNQGHRPESEWTMPLDIYGTLMQWGCHDNDCLQLLKRIQTPPYRARQYHEKLTRRFNHEFAMYDALIELSEASTAGSSSGTATEVRKIGDGIRLLVKYARLDYLERNLVDDRTARQMVQTLIEVCKRHNNLASTPRSSDQGDRRISLFDELIRDSSNRAVFILDVLESMRDETLAGLGPGLVSVSNVLEKLKAPSAYISRINALCGRANMSTAMSSSGTIGGSSEEPRAGAKRPAGDSTGSRGKRRT